MIKIKEIEIQTPKWWQTGLIIIAVISITIIAIKISPEEAVKIMDRVIQKMYQK